MSLSHPEKVRKLQTALHVKAKGSLNYRFYLLYDKVYRNDVLNEAWRQCRWSISVSILIFIPAE